MIPPEIVKALLNMRGEPVTERKVRAATSRVWGYLRRFREEGIATGTRTKGARFHAWSLNKTNLANVSDNDTKVKKSSSLPKEEGSQRLPRKTTETTSAKPDRTGPTKPVPGIRIARSDGSAAVVGRTRKNAANAATSRVRMVAPKPKPRKSATIKPRKSRLPKPAKRPFIKTAPAKPRARRGKRS